MKGLTERDLQIFRMISSQGLVISEDTLPFFRSIRVAQNRLSKLVSKGILESEKIKKLSIIIPSLRSVSELSSIGINKERKCYYFAENLRRIQKTVFEPEIIKHNIITNHVFAKIKSHLGSEALEHIFEKEVRSGNSQYIPDITFIGKNFKLGIEVERILKRDRTRYYMKFFKLQESKYTHILYVCMNREIEKAVHKLAQTMPFIGTTVLTEELRVTSHGKALKEFLSECYHEN